MSRNFLTLTLQGTWHNYVTLRGELRSNLICSVSCFSLKSALERAFLLVFSCTVLEYHIWFLVFFLRSWLAGRDPTLWPSCLGLWIWRGDWSWRTQKHIRWWEKIIGYRCEWYCGSYFVMDLHFRSQSSVCLFFVEMRWGGAKLLSATW